MGLHARRFTMKNDGFHCENCGLWVPPLRSGCRNHCPHCVTSKHVDIKPGDRQNSCGKLMDLVDFTISGKKGVVLEFCCRGCGLRSRNKAALDDETADNLDQIMRKGNSVHPI